MNRLTTALTICGLCCGGVGTTAEAGLLDALWNLPQQVLSPVAQPGILPGGCYAAPAGGGLGWCGTPPPASSYDANCPNGLPFPVMPPRDPVGRYSQPPLPGALPRYDGYAPRYPAVNGYPMLGADGFGATRPTFATDLETGFDGREYVRPGTYQPNAARPLPGRPTGDFHILPVYEGRVPRDRQDLGRPLYP